MRSFDEEIMYGMMYGMNLTSENLFWKELAKNYAPQIGSFQITSRPRGRHKNHQILTPVKEPCKFLAMYTRESEVSGCPAGVTQECTHPVQREFKALKRNMTEFVLFLRELLGDWDIKTNPLTRITAIPAIIDIFPTEALELPNPADFDISLLDRMNRWIGELRTLCETISDNLHDLDDIEDSTSDTKGFTKKFEEQEK